MKNVIPDFFVVGAQKAGTSTLHEWLAQSDEIALPWTKETNFFRDEKKYSQGLTWYAKQFHHITPKTKIVGEIDPEYMYFPWCAERIKLVIPAPKLIFVLRDPLARARSHYQMSHRRGYETLSFPDALTAESERLNKDEMFSKIHHSYIDRGLYARQIERILQEFPNSEILILLFDDLFSSQNSASKSLMQICNFLGISNDKINVNINLRENQASSPRFKIIRDFIYGSGKIKSFFGKMIPSRELKIRIMKSLDMLNSKSALKQKSGSKNTAVEKIPAFVYSAFIEDLYKLETISNVDVKHWIQEYERALQHE